MRRMRPVILLLAVVALFLFGRWYFHEAGETYVTRAQAARMLAYALYDMEAEKQEEERSLIDVEDGIWYADEIQAVVRHGVMLTDGDLFHPTDPLTYEEAVQAAAQLGYELDTPLLKKHRAIPLGVWLDFYDLCISGLNTVEMCRLQIEAIPATSDEMEPWQVRTSQGIYLYEGVPLEAYVGQTVRAYISGDQLLMAVGRGDGRVTEIAEAAAMGTVSGETRETAENHQAKETLVDETCAEGTEEEEEETKARSQGADSSEKEWDIRVCLMTTGYTSEYHEKVSLMADHDWQITYADGSRQCAAGETVTLTAADFSEDGDCAEISAQANGRLQVLSIERSSGCPSYEGCLRVIRSGNALLLVNILPLEHYLYGVVPGEMPADYGGEALKAQAVCARSYAMLAMAEPRYDFADVNDSTACQVYMNQGTDERCTAAVEETAGQVLMSGEKIVTAKYFSTSCGSLSDSDDIWLYPDELESAAHMTARLETEPPDIPALNEETVFRFFIDEPETGKYVEENEAWFRWQVRLTMAEIGASIQRYLKQRMAVSPKGFTLLSDDGEIDPEKLASVEILERAVSGVVRKIRITGEGQVLTVSGEYNIRCMLAPSGDQAIVLSDGSERRDLSLLPSGYFYLEEVQADVGSAKSYLIKGGGLGHGAGMSQNGARILAERGYSYEAILNYYFENVSVGKPEGD